LANDDDTPVINREGKTTRPQPPGLNGSVLNGLLKRHLAIASAPMVCHPFPANQNNI
jgi:hypothetical protein